MSIFCGDIVVKNLLTLGLEDLRTNPWLVQDALSGVIGPATSTDLYGQKEIQNALTWFQNNKVQVISQFAFDKMEPPCITIGLGSSNEQSDMATMGDRDVITERLVPSQIGKPIPYIVSPFAPTSINNQTGFVGIPSNLNTESVAIGMNLLNPSNGNAYPIIGLDPNGIYLEANALLNANAPSFGIIPQYAYYEAHRERAWFTENYTIGCHVAGDIAQVLWLSAITTYLILRYRESLLERNGFMQSSINCADIMPNPNFAQSVGADKVYSRMMTLTGIVQNDWIKQPYRVIEAVVDAPSPNSSFTGGIKIISNR